MALERDFALSPADLFATVTSFDFLAARSARFGGVGDPEIVDDAGTRTVRSSRQLPLDKMPSVARGFLGDGVVVQEDVWTVAPDSDGSIGATWATKLGTAPASVGGTHTIAATDGGSHYEITADVTVNVPMFGRKIEEQVSGFLDVLITKELDFLESWVAEHG